MSMERASRRAINGSAWHEWKTEACWYFRALVVEQRGNKVSGGATTRSKRRERGHSRRAAGESCFRLRVWSCRRARALTTLITVDARDGPRNSGRALSASTRSTSDLSTNMWMGQTHVHDPPPTARTHTWGIEGTTTTRGEAGRGFIASQSLQSVCSRDAVTGHDWFRGEGGIRTCCAPGQDRPSTRTRAGP